MLHHTWLKKTCAEVLHNISIAIKRLGYFALQSLTQSLAKDVDVEHYDSLCYCLHMSVFSLTLGYL